MGCDVVAIADGMKPAFAIRQLVFTSAQGNLGCCNIEASIRSSSECIANVIHDLFSIDA